VRTDRLRRERGVELRYSVFPLHPAIPEEGMELADLFPGRASAIAEMQARLARIAESEGLPISPRSRTYNSRLAQELGKWAEGMGAGDAFRHAVYRAYFVDGVNIGKVDELVRIADEAGLPPGEARSILAARTLAEAVDADWIRAGERGIDAVPAHLCGDRRLVGFAPYDDFLRLIGIGL
jgi:predicted DsbA family dithiol-disulfide isomerase